MYKKLLKIFISLIVFYVITLSAVYLVTPTPLERHAQNGLALIEKETLYPKYFFENNNACMLDNFTDKVMLERVLPKNVADNALEQAMFMNGYSRYWHGYQVILRPLLLPFNYFEIRYINIFIMFALLIKAMNVIKKNVNSIASWLFFAAVMCAKFIIVPVSLQFTNMMMLMLLAILSADKLLCNRNGLNFNNKTLNTERLFIFSFVLGSITVFLDLLTTPILPIGIVMLLLVIHYYQKYNYLIPNKTIINSFIFWSAGYVGTWAAKWILATVICSQNIILQAFNQVVFRVAGDGAKYEVHRLSMLESNIKMLIQPFGHTPKIIIFSLIFIVCGILLYKFRKTVINKIFIKKIIWISLIPYLWYLMAANHSQIHFWFTYRSQIITVFGLGYAMYYVTDWQKVKSSMKGKFKCLK